MNIRTKSEKASRLLTHVSIFSAAATLPFVPVSAIYNLPGGDLTVWGWSALAMLGSSLSFYSVLRGLPELEEGALLLTTTCLFVYGLSGFFLNAYDSFFTPGLLLIVALGFSALSATLRSRQRQQSEEMLLKVKDQLDGSDA